MHTLIRGLRSAPHSIRALIPAWPAGGAAIASPHRSTPSQSPLWRSMDDPNSGMGDDVSWNEILRPTSQFEDMTSDSPFNEFINAETTFGDSPGLTLRAPSKTSRELAGAVSMHPQYPPIPTGPSAESSSQDSASDSSSRRKRKVTESPMSDPAVEAGMRNDDTVMDMGVHGDVNQLQNYPTRPMNELSLEQEASMWSDWNNQSAASSPIQPGKFNQAMSLNQQGRVPTTTMPSQYQQSPVQTINPGSMFHVADPREESPLINNMFNANASPQAIFSSTSSSNSPEAFGGSQWNSNLTQTPAWLQDFSGQYTSPGAGLGTFSPSSAMNGATPPAAPAPALGLSPLHISPLSTKSRVETQINVIMTLEKPPPGIEHLHLPLHTIAKSKLLSKEDVDPSRTLELHTMLVCSSAMNNPQWRAKALERAAAQRNSDVQNRAERIREAVAKATSEEEKNMLLDPSKNVSEEEKATNGGEVRICANCIQRERKRAGRKKLKREEEQQHWERFETERVVVFNSNEYLPFKPPEQNMRDNGPMPTHADAESQYIPPEGSLQVTAAMRIACYCRHQSEKEGFRVIFTLKDQQGNVVAQQMSDSILITDDHKTHAPSFATVTADGFGAAFNHGFGPHGIPMSHSMLDLQQAALQQGAHAFTSSRSTGNLQALAYGQQQFNPQSHIHHLPQSGYTSQATSATMTPTTLSRPASPTGAGQTGPNKKRKSSTFHKRIPSGLTMTPARVDTNQTPGSSLPSGASTLTSPFSPSGEGFGGQQSFMTIPANNGPANYYVGSGPSTPSETQQQFMFSQTQFDQHLMRDRSAAAYFSHPSSAVPSRSGSPVLQQSRSNMPAYARQPHQSQTTTHPLSGQRQQHMPQSQPGMYPQQVAGAAEPDNSSPPTITKITPGEGPVVGGTEVSIYGYNFPEGARLLFGEKQATTVWYGPQALLATSPPSRPGGVNVTLLPPAGQSGTQYASPPGNRQIFTYTDKDPIMMEMALKYVSQQQTGNATGWNQLASRYASSYVNASMTPAGIGGQANGDL